MRIILDFDYTLFDTFRFKEAIKDAFKKNGVSYDLFEQTREESKNGQRDWKPKIQFEILKARGVKNIPAIQKDFEREVASAEDFLYEDTMPFLQKAKHIYSFFLVTYGEDEFQNAKVDACPVFKEYFDKIVITQNIYKDKEVRELADGKPAIFVEDNPIALAATKKIAPNIETVRMKRPHGHYVSEPNGNGIDYEISNLYDLKISDKRSSS